MDATAAYTRDDGVSHQSFPTKEEGQQGRKAQRHKKERKDPIVYTFLSRSRCCLRMNNPRTRTEALLYV